MWERERGWVGGARREGGGCMGGWVWRHVGGVGSGCIVTVLGTTHG